MGELNLIIFGGTGDLAKRKLIPAFAKLIQKKQISSKSTIIGIGRSNFNNKSYKEMILDFNKNSKENLKDLNIKYVQTDATKKGGLDPLKELLSKQKSKTCNRIFYYSTSFNLFEKINEELKRTKLNKNQCGYSRIAFEKPFGKDYKSANKFENNLHKIFKEEQIFRVDHYLGKETVKNLTVLKNSNPIFNEILNNKLVKDIKIFADEDLPVGKRASYYNEFGAIKDMIQNHLLQILSLLLMEKTKIFTTNEIHKEKLKVLKCLKLLPMNKQLIGEYESYKEELKKQNIEYKKTETFAKIKLECPSKRWKGVPITLQTGKMLKEKSSKIIIKFKSPKDFKNQENFKSNKLIFDIQPRQDMKLEFNIFKKGENTLENVSSEFCHECYFGANTADGYEKIFEDIIAGDQTRFSTSEEIKQAWKIVDKLEEHKKKIKYVTYQDSWNTKELT